MLKKLVIVVLLAGAGYVGWLAWTKYLAPSDKERIKQKLEHVKGKLEKGAAGLAKKTAKLVHEKLGDKEQQPAGQPGKLDVKSGPAPVKAPAAKSE